LLLDDVHWADRDSLELLEVMTRQVESTSILIVVTYRSEDVHRHHPLYDLLPTLQRDRPVESVELHRLDRADTAVIAEASCGPCSPQLIDSLHARSEGNPFFLVELLRDFVERQVLARADSLSAVPISGGQLPVVLQQVITRRIARLGEEAEQLLQVAAIVGEEWDLGIVEAVLGWQEDQLLRTLEAALEARVVAPSAEEAEQYRFTHGLIREVLCTEQAARRRKHLHERIAAVLEGQIPSGRVPAGWQAGHMAALAHHFGAAEQWDKALQYNLAAGDAARDRYASRSALQFYEQALDIVHTVPGIAQEQAGLYDRLGQVRMGLIQMEAARSAYEHMLLSAQLEGDRVAESRALFWLSFVQARLSHVKEARVAGDAAICVSVLAFCQDPLRVLAGGYCWSTQTKIPGSTTVTIENSGGG
jgi:predicted ATPase